MPRYPPRALLNYQSNPGKSNHSLCLCRRNNLPWIPSSIVLHRSARQPAMPDTRLSMRLPELASAAQQRRSGNLPHSYLTLLIGSAAQTPKLSVGALQQQLWPVTHAIHPATTPVSQRPPRGGWAIQALAKRYVRVTCPHPMAASYPKPFIGHIPWLTRDSVKCAMAQSL